MPQLSEARVRHEGNVLLYPVTGDFTARSAMLYKEEMLKSKDRLSGKVILDMTAVADADIVGVNVLVQLLLFVRRQGGVMEVHLTRGGSLDNILRLTKFHHYFNLVFPS